MKIDKKVLLTGHSGFLGRNILNKLKFKKIVCLGRSSPDSSEVEFFKGDLSKDMDYSQCLRGVDIVIHAAARVHIMKEKDLDPLSAYRQINTNATLHLAKEALKQGVKRFIFISTIKVNGEKTNGQESFTHLQEPSPIDDYALSKYEAELGIQAICKNSEMEFVILRLPLVYGKGVSANFRSLLLLVKKRIPLPFAKIKNKRSFISIDNFISLLRSCIEMDEARNQIFLASDGHDLSTEELVQIMGKVCNTRTLLFPLPSLLVLWLFRLIGKEGYYQRLYSSLQINIDHTRQTLRWEPASNVEESIRESV